MEITPSIEFEIKRLYLQEGVGERKISKILGFKHPSTVHKYLKRQGITRGNTQHLNKGIISNISWDKSNFQKSSEIFALFVLSMIGSKVMKPLDIEPFDFLIEINGNFKKVQVKFSSSKRNGKNFIFSLVRVRSNSKGIRKIFYKKDEVDFFLLIDEDENAWFIPFSELENKKTCTPCLTFPGCKIR